MNKTRKRQIMFCVTDEEFADYLLGEEKKYSEMKARAEKLAIEKAKTLGVDGVKEGAGHGGAEGDNE